MPKKEKIQEMFDGIAPSYDKLNHVMSLNVDKLWRRHALKEIVDGTPQQILDVACGTGDSTIAIATAMRTSSSELSAYFKRALSLPLEPNFWILSFNASVRPI